MYQYNVTDPLWETLKELTGVEPPGFCKGVHMCSQLENDELVDILQSWCLQHAKPVWSSGIGLLEAAEKIVEAAVENGRIGPPIRRLGDPDAILKKVADVLWPNWVTSGSSETHECLEEIKAILQSSGYGPGFPSVRE